MVLKSVFGPRRKETWERCYSSIRGQRDHRVSHEREQDVRVGA